MTRGGNTRKTGARYELLAAVHLEKCGYHIIEKNYRCRIGEIDLVACDGAYLVFVEVKYRADASKGNPLEAVGPAKQERVRRTAAWYLMVKDLDCPARFDVAEVYAEGPHPQKASRIEYIENAF